MIDFLTFVCAFLVFLGLFRWLGLTEYRRRRVAFSGDSKAAWFWIAAFTLGDAVFPADSGAAGLGDGGIGSDGGFGGGESGGAGCGGCGG